MAQVLESSTGCSVSGLLLNGKKLAGTFSVAEVVNENDRLYTRRLWEKKLKNPVFMNKLRNRRVLGELGHPDIVETTLRDVSHVVTYLELKDDNTIYGEAEILDTPSGRILEALYKAKIGLGISSRGYLPEGVELIPEGSVWLVPEDDYELITFDFVIDPSAPGAFPSIKESVVSSMKKLLTESDNHINKEVSSFIEGLSVKKPINSALFENSTGGKGSTKKTKQDTGKIKEATLMHRDYKGYSKQLLDVTEELRKRYLNAEGVIEEMTRQHRLSDGIVQDLSKRYLTAESVIGEIRDYALRLEGALAETANELKVAEEVISDLSARYTLSEDIISELSKNHTMAEAIIADMRDEINALREGKSVKGSKIAESTQSLQEKLRLSESVIEEMRKQVVETPKKKRPVPAGYFEGIADTYGVSVKEAKEIFKNCGNKQEVFEYHMAERKRLLSRRYGEFPYMNESVQQGGNNDVDPTSIYESTDETAKVARMVSRIL